MTRARCTRCAGLPSHGQADHVLASAEDGVVLPDEDITQDPQAASAVADAGTAAVVLRLSEAERERAKLKGISTE